MSTARSDHAAFLRRRWGSTPPPEGTTEPVKCVAVDRDERCLCPGGPASHRPSPPAPAAEDDAVVDQRVRHVLSSHGIEEDIFEGEGAAAGYTHLVANLIDAAGVRALRAARDLARADARMVRAERDAARQQVADLRARIEDYVEHMAAALPHQRIKCAEVESELRAALAGPGES